MLTVLAEAIQSRPFVERDQSSRVTVASVDTAMSPRIAQTLSVMPGVYTIGSQQERFRRSYSVYVIPTWTPRRDSSTEAEAWRRRDRLPARTP